MNRHRIAALSAAVALAGAATAGVVVVAGPAPAAGRPAAAAAAVRAQPVAASADQLAQQSYVRANAAHLCAVQATVYGTSKELAAAYAATPDYPGLSAAQVKAFGQRMATDVGFSAQLAQELRTGCGGAAKR